ncbi:MAG TPA: hypothetical protein DIT76_09980 [Spartobacteria bacterium]|nr:hypothetical protein [Spartobacteria bacterium]
MLVAALTVVTVLGWFSQTSLAYSLEGQEWPAGTTVVLQLGLGSAFRTLQDGNTSWDTAASPALGMWNVVMQRLQFSGVLTSSRSAMSGDGLNSVVFSSSVFGQSFGSGTLAVTYYRSSGSTMSESDTLFNRAESFDSYRGALQYGVYDIRRILLHELGHALGLAHPDDNGQNVVAIMNSNISDLYTLQTDDISGAQYLYGAPTSTTTTAKIYWQNSSTGERQIWLMNGTVHTATASLGIVPTQWNIATSADFNGDGNVDIVWQNSSTGQRLVWFMNGTTHVSTVSLPTVSPSWEIATASDFNGDRKPDLLWQNNSTGQRVIWFMNGTTYVSSVSLGFVGASWKITGSGDFNGDGKADILWHNNGTGQSCVWLMNGSKFVSTVNLPTVSTAWSMVGTGEFNGDGKRDILWQNKSTGQRVVWLMNRTTYAGYASLGIVPIQWNIRNF